MKKTLFFLLLSCSAILLPAATAETAPAQSSQQKSQKIILTLEQARRIAVTQNPSQAQARAAIMAAAAAVKQAWSSYYPRIDLTGSITRHRDAYGRNYASEDYPDGRYKTNTEYYAGANATWLIFDGFQRELALMDAKSGKREEEVNAQDTQRLLLNAVSQAYYAVLLAQANMKIAQEDEAFNRVLLDDAQKRYEGGVTKQSEVLNFVLGVERAGVNYISAEKEWKVANIALGALLTFNRDDIWEKYELVSPEMDSVSTTINLQEGLDFAHQHRPDLRAIEERLLRAKHAVTTARAQWSPTVTLFADYNFDRISNPHFTRPTDREIQFGGRVNWNFFNGFQTSSAIASAKANLLIIKKQKEQLLLDIDSEIRQAFLAYQSTLIQLEKQKKVLDTAKQIRDLVHQEYIGGTTTITRLNEAQTDMNNAANAHSAAFIQVLNSLEAFYTATARNIQ